MIKLSANLNKIALLRNQRTIGYPSVTETARRMIAAGAAGITVHPRPDERHIRRSDVLALAAFLRRENCEAIEFNVEGNPTPEFLALVAEVQPDQVTLVPDDPGQSTSDHGWDLAKDRSFLIDIVGGLRSQGFRVALFVDSDPSSLPIAAEVGADRVELYTGPYAEAFGGSDFEAVLAAFLASGQAAAAAGLGLNAGHDLNLANLPPLVAGLPNLLEVSIGHALAADALYMGLSGAVEAYLAVLSGAPSPQGLCYPSGEYTTLERDDLKSVRR